MTESLEPKSSPPQTLFLKFMGPKTFLAFKHGHSFLFLFIFLVNSFADRLFLKYERFEALAGSDSQISFDPFLFNWKTLNEAVLILNLAAVLGILVSFGVKQTYPKFWLFFAFVFLINLIYPSGMWMVDLPGFHFVPVSIIVINGYGLFTLVFLRTQGTLVKPANPNEGAEENGRDRAD